MENLLREFRKISKKVTNLEELTDNHIEALNRYFQVLISNGVKPDKIKVYEYIESILIPLKTQIEELKNRIDEELNKIDHWIYEYENAEIILKEDFEKGLEALHSSKEELKNLKLDLQQLEDKLNTIKKRYQE